MSRCGRGRSGKSREGPTRRKAREECKDFGRELRELAKAVNSSPDSEAACSSLVAAVVHDDGATTEVTGMGTYA